MKIQEETHSSKKYRVFLSSTFLDLKELRASVIQRLSRAGLLYFAMETLPASPEKLEEKLKKEIEDCDIFVLLVRESPGTFQIKGVPVTRFESRYAKQLKKPVLSYFTDNGYYGAFSGEIADFKNEVLQSSKYCKIVDQDHVTAANIITDILALIALRLDLGYWVRTDITRDTVNAMVEEKIRIDHKFRAGSQLIQFYKRILGSQNKAKFDELEGPLIDLGLSWNATGRPYRFVAGESLTAEKFRGQLSYQYVTERFQEYENGAVYDSKLDLCWFQVKHKNFTWAEANEIDFDGLPDILAAGEFESPHGLPAQWRVPAINELMTLLTHTRFQKAYIDNEMFPQEHPNFWSASVDPDKKCAFYIETVRGEVLKDAKLADPDPHRKGLILCIDGRLKKGKVKIQKPDVDLQCETPASMNNVLKARRVYGVYLSAFTSSLITPESLEKIRRDLAKNGYVLTTFSSFGSRPGSTLEAIRAEMRTYDYYIIVLDHKSLSSGGALEDITRQEILIARETGLPMSLFHNLDGDLEGVCGKLGLRPDETGIPGYVTGPQHMPAEILAVLHQQEESNPRPGWIQRHVFEEIRRSIKSFNETIEKLEEIEEPLNRFIQAYPGEVDRSKFEECGLLTEIPVYGKQTRFVSKENPAERFLTGEDSQDHRGLPILYTRVVNRFEPRPCKSRPDNTAAVFDHYLKIKWWTFAQKNSSFTESEAFASRVSKDEAETWRLPTVQELITLITYRRGNRKYMDETVFPRGRWFWASRIPDDHNHWFVDFNYSKGSVGKEMISETGTMPSFRKKSVLLVCDCLE
jgi:nucleoside 2-deoxyribosyltransferase